MVPFYYRTIHTRSSFSTETNHAAASGIPLRNDVNQTFHLANELQTRNWGASFVPRLAPGDVVLLHGELGAGKTTLVRGIMEALGHDGPVRSPTYNLIQTFATEPPVMHADLYRVKGAEGTGLEDYLDTHICLIEWPDRAYSLFDPHDCWQVRIDFEGTGRVLTLTYPRPHR